MVDNKAFVRGSWGAEIVADLAPLPEDIVIEGKRGLDTFASTNLDFILRSRGIRNLVVAGFLTNCCVESTVRTGSEKGFQVTAISDCTATVSEEEQRFTFEKTSPCSRVSLRTMSFWRSCQLSSLIGSNAAGVSLVMRSMKAFAL